MKKLALVSMFFALLCLSGCETDSPKCSDPITLYSVKEITFMQLEKYGIKGFSKETFIQIESPLVNNYDEKTNKYSCKAKIIFNDLNLQKDIDYSSQLNEEKKHIISSKLILSPDEIELIKQNLAIKNTNKKGSKQKTN